jgi:threonine/homoserine/homoserine lactone efflux protein
MLFLLFLKGCFLGLCIAMPVGPIGVLAIQYSLINGRRSGFVAGLGAATADALYGLLAGFGMTAISLFLIEQLQWFHWLGTSILFILGLSILLSSPPQQTVSPQPVRLLKIFSTTFILTLTNPLTLLCFAALYTALGINTCTHRLWTPLIFSAGIFIGSALWWLALSTAVSALFKTPSPRLTYYLRMFSGGVLIVFGLIAGISGLSCYS